MKLLNIGYGNLVVASRVVAVVGPGAAPVRRLREEAGKRGKLVDARTTSCCRRSTPRRWP
jgi:regulator of extracellular matrix RemA (YlzA/DUF370 family)